MAGEMSESDVTREAYPLHFAIADALGGTVHPFDQYQGPYVMVGAADATVGTPPYAMPLPTRITGGHRLWITSDDGVACQVFDEANGKVSETFLANLGHEDDDAHAVINAAVEVTGLVVAKCPVCEGAH